MGKENLINRLCYFHNIIVASIPLLDFAIERADDDLKTYYKKHKEEEINHDKVLLADINSMGITEIPLNINAVELAGSQYYMIAHSHPSALLGYMAALERESVNDEDITNIEEILGVPMNCMRLHAKLDVDHIIELDNEIAKLPKELADFVRGNEQYTKDKINNYFEAIEN